MTVLLTHYLVESSSPISEGTQNPQLKERKNTAKIVLGFTVVFLISCVPDHTYETIYIPGCLDIPLHEFQMKLVALIIYFKSNRFYNFFFKLIPVSIL